MNITLFLLSILLLLAVIRGESTFVSSKHRSARFWERRQSSKTASSLQKLNTGNLAHQYYNPFPNQILNERGAFRLEIDGGGVPFGFGSSFTWAYQSFYFYLPTTHSYAFLVWDCYCSGDRFEVYLNGESRLTTDTGCTPSSSYTPGQCQPHLTDPAACFYTPGFCSNDGVEGNTLNGIGFYNLTIKVLESYYGLGIGYVGLYSLINSNIACTNVIDCSNID